MFGLIPTPPTIAPWGVLAASSGDGPDSCTEMGALARRGGAQLATQSCTGWAAAGVLHVLCRLLGIDLWPSPSGIYYVGRKRTAGGGPIIDIGARLTDVCAGVQEAGVIPEALWPFRESTIDDEPPWDALDSGLDWRRFRLRRIVSVGEQRCRDVRLSLAARKPLVRGMAVDERYLRWSRADGPWTRTGQIVGRHAEAVLTYDREGLAGISSWGDGPTEAGDRIQSWEHLQSDDVSDLWAAEVV